jgi:peroxiredoxin (alkyl hydroperoxide reductase subunit C)
MLQTHEISKKFGVLLTEGENAGVTLRSLFVIDPTGKIRATIVHDLPVGRNVDEILRIVKAFQYTDKFGEVCPAGWHEGAATIKPSIDESKEYFAAANP